MKIAIREIHLSQPLREYIDASNRGSIAVIILLVSAVAEFFIIVRYYMISSLEEEAPRPLIIKPSQKSTKQTRVKGFGTDEKIKDFTKAKPNDVKETFFHKKKKNSAILEGMSNISSFRETQIVEDEVDEADPDETVIDLKLNHRDDSVTSILENSAKILGSFDEQDNYNEIEEELDEIQDLYDDKAVEMISTEEEPELYEDNICFVDELSDDEDFDAEPPFCEELDDDFDENYDDEFDDEPDHPTLESIDKIEEIDDFEVETDLEEELEADIEVAPKIQSPARSAAKKYDVPTNHILNEYADSKSWIVDAETKRAADILKTTLEEFKIMAEVTGIRKGPVITMFEVLPAPGVKLSKIVNLADNIALRLAASRVRIVAPIPGKHAVGIEVPNKKRSLVSFKEIVEDEGFANTKLDIPVILGKDISGDSNIIDLAQTPHLLIAGATGSGKSVCVNSLITSILYKKNPDEVKMILIDPKIVELKLYNDIPHLLTPVITEPKKAYQALQYCLAEMERRYSLLDSLGVRDIKSFNQKIKVKKIATNHLPYIVVVIDEFADLMATTGKELEATIARLAAMSRAVGIHIVLATQRPSVDVITGIIKANIPSRIAFMVASKFDSRIIIDSVGAEKLLGKGDMLFSSAWEAAPTRIQGAFLSEEEVEKVVDHVKTLGEPEYIDEEIFIDDEEDYTLFDVGGEDDPLMQKALEIVSSTGKASASFLQRRLKIGYNRAARIVEIMEERGLVGPQNGSKPRDVFISQEHL
ncbi:MAG: DUF87 domain-containing protein [Spirochaetales bacterium]|nr:DUF87 domain-containing protein [Spirochaetales bacterium]